MSGGGPAALLPGILSPLLPAYYVEEKGGFGLLGQLVLTPGGRGKTAAGRLYGLPVLRAEADPAGFWGERRLRRAGRTLRRGGALRVLAPRDVLPLLAGFGLHPVDPQPFVRAQGTSLVLAALERLHLAPDRAAVALRGGRVDRDMVRTAEQLCRRVRSLVIDAPQGGGELAARLRREYGVPVLPPGERGHAALLFQEGRPAEEEVLLEVFGPQPRLAGLTLSAPGLEEGDRESLPLLAVLWECGRLAPQDIKIT